MVDISKIVQYESGELDEEGVIELFQAMIDDGSAWHLQGHYGRTAMDLLKSGQCQLAPVPHKDAYGIVIPSREQGSFVEGKFVKK